MIDVIVLFTGMLSFVPEKELQPNVENAFTVYALEGKAMNPEHVTTLLVKKSVVAKAADGCVIEKHPKGVEFYRCDLEPGEFIDFPVQNQNCLEEPCVDTEYNAIYNSEDFDSECPTETNRGDLYWLANLDAITLGRGDPSKKKLKKKKNVRARFNLREGSIRVAEFSRIDLEDLYNGLGGSSSYNFNKELLPHDDILFSLGDDPEESSSTSQYYSSDRFRVINWEISRAKEDFNQALADLVEFKYESSERSLVISSKSSQRTLMFKDNLGEIYVEIKNVPEKDICQDGEGTLPPEDLHFKHYYSLLKDSPGLDGLEFYWLCPVLGVPGFLTTELCRPPMSRLNDPQCPDARMNPL